MSIATRYNLYTYALLVPVDELDNDYSPYFVEERYYGFECVQGNEDEKELT